MYALLCREREGELYIYRERDLLLNPSRININIGFNLEPISDPNHCWARIELNLC